MTPKFGFIALVSNYVLKFACKRLPKESCLNDCQLDQSITFPMLLLELDSLLRRNYYMFCQIREQKVG